MSNHADLHIHTTASDGDLDPAAVPAVAREAGLAVVALTDHDRFHEDFPAPVIRTDGVTVVHGIELKVQTEMAGRIDLLGYDLDPTTALREEITRLQHDRIERGAAIIENVESHLDISLNLEATEGIGRPHIARAVAEHPATEYDVQGVFDDLIADGQPCFVPRAVTPFETGKRLLSDACSIVGIAHPLRYADPTAVLELAADVDAIERAYPYEEPVDLTPVDRTIETHDLLATGGSDAHDNQIGRVGLSAVDYEPVAARLPTPVDAELSQS
ncbi:MAG: PHP domain-containing protein [Halobacteriales archaeon]